MSENETVELLRDIKKILGVIYLSSIGSLKRELLPTELDQRVYDLCARKSVEEIASQIPELGYDGIRNRVSEWEKRGLLVSEQESSGRGGPKKLFTRIEEFLR